MNRKSRSGPGERVCLLSPHPLVLAELHRLLDGNRFRLQLVRLESALAPQLFELEIPRASIYVVDANLPAAAIEALVTSITRRCPAARLLILAERVDDSTAFPLLRLGVKGVVGYRDIRRQLPSAVREVASGGFWAPRMVLSRFVESMLQGHSQGVPLRTAAMSGRERQVLEALLESLSNKEIGERLHISERTVKFHVSNLLAKFGVERRQHLILHCFQSRQNGH